MQVRSVVLSVCGGVIFLALVWLSVKVSANPATGASDEQLAQARAYHKRHKRRSVTPEVSPPPTRRKSPRVKRQPPPRAETSNDGEKRKPRVKRRGAWNRPATKPLRRLKLSGNKRGTELRDQMRNANKAYDRQDYEEATKAALDILKKHPRNIRMLRVVVSSACFMGEAEQAKKYYAKLPKRDKSHMRIRCTRMKIKLDE